MEKRELEIPIIKKLSVYKDERGLFMEIFKEKDFEFFKGKHFFVQENYSLSKKNVLRGLHYQIHNIQGKLIKVINGEINDVSVDLRKDSIYFGCSYHFNMKKNNNEVLWIPPGFAHGFYTLEDNSEIIYIVTDYYDKEAERTILWNDEDLNIDWGIPNGITPIVSEKDSQGIPFRLAQYM